MTTADQRLSQQLDTLEEHNTAFQVKIQTLETALSNAVDSEVAAKQSELNAAASAARAQEIAIGNIPDGGIDTTHLANASVTAAKLDMPLQARVLPSTIGAAGQVLTSDGAAAVWQALPAQNIVHNHVNTPVRYASTSLRHITPLDTTITIAEGSRVLVVFNVSYEGFYDGVFSLRRNGNAIGRGVANSSSSSGIRPIPYDNNFGTTQSLLSLHYLDAPSAAGTYTYSLYYVGTAANFALNRTFSDDGSTSTERTSSDVILQEIKA